MLGSSPGAPELSLESANSTARSVDPFASLAALRAASQPMPGKISTSWFATASKLLAPAPTALSLPPPLRLSASSVGVVVERDEPSRAEPAARVRSPGTAPPPPDAATPPPPPVRPNRSICRTMRTAESAPRAARDKPSGVGGRCTAGPNASGLWWRWCPPPPLLLLSLFAVAVVLALSVALVDSGGTALRASPPACSPSPLPPWWAWGDGLMPPTEGCHGMTVRQIGQSGSCAAELLRYCRRQPVWKKCWHSSLFRAGAAMGRCYGVKHSGS